DLYNAGIGNGEHGFIIDVDFNSMPEERFTVELHYVDGSGYHPVFYTGYYDNRKQISLLGMVDYQGYDRSTWMWNDEVINYCENIGCSSLMRNNIADDEYYTRMIRDSSYCAIATHGPSPDEETGEIYYDAIQWSMRGVYNGHTECENKYCPTCFGWYTTDDLKELSDGYFSTTRCVALGACYAGYNRENNPDNFVNVLQSKGVWTVVGFELATQTAADEDTKIVDPDKGAQKWLKEFTEFLGEGKTVQNATILATAATTENGFAYGTDKYYIAGDNNQIVKH
ncbi:MAG: hypothetical protein IJY79_04670, partial [Clostridia bacterium]|nr:hypothetical protein [Clostridia bacterium]